MTYNWTNEFSQIGKEARDRFIRQQRRIFQCNSMSGSQHQQHIGTTLVPQQRSRVMFLLSSSRRLVLFPPVHVLIHELFHPDTFKKSLLFPFTFSQHKHKRNYAISTLADFALTVLVAF